MGAQSEMRRAGGYWTSPPAGEVICMTQNFPTVTPISTCQIIYRLGELRQRRFSFWEQTSHEDELLNCVLWQ